MNDPKVIIALDHDTDEQALAFLQRLDAQRCRIKIGSILFTHYGPALIEKIKQGGFTVFLDLKFHDIPQTVAGACRAAAELGIWMVNVHICGGREMMLAARQAIQAYPVSQRPLLIGVTVLTSLDDQDIAAIGYQHNVEETVLHFARMAQEAGLDGVVCSAQEALILRRHLPPPFLLVTPGIRLPNDAVGDQKRIMTPQDAMAAGANYLVIGRAITQSPQPRQTLEKILGELRVN